MDVFCCSIVNNISAIYPVSTTHFYFIFAHFAPLRLCVETACI
jgi:hypothetical protein